MVKKKIGFQEKLEIINNNSRLKIYRRIVLILLAVYLAITFLVFIGTVTTGIYYKNNQELAFLFIALLFFWYIFLYWSTYRMHSWVVVFFFLAIFSRLFLDDFNIIEILFSIFILVITIFYNLTIININKIIKPKKI